MTTSDEDREMCDTEQKTNTNTIMCNRDDEDKQESDKEVNIPDLNALAAMAAVITPNQMAQLAAQAMANPENENVIKNLALLQSTIFNLQHQQVMQLQLIQKLQNYLVANPNSESNEQEKIDGENLIVDEANKNEIESARDKQQEVEKYLDNSIELG